MIICFCRCYVFVSFVFCGCHDLVFSVCHYEERVEASICVLEQRFKRKSCFFYTADLEERSAEEEEEEEGWESSARTDVGAGEGETAAIVSSDSGVVSAVGEKNPVSVGQTRGTFFSA